MTLCLSFRRKPVSTVPVAWCSPHWIPACAGTTHPALSYRRKPVSTVPVAWWFEVNCHRQTVGPTPRVAIDLDHPAAAAGWADWRHAHCHLRCQARRRAWRRRRPPRGGRCARPTRRQSAAAPVRPALCRLCRQCRARPARYRRLSRCDDQRRVAAGPGALGPGAHRAAGAARRRAPRRLRRNARRSGRGPRAAPQRKPRRAVARFRCGVLRHAGDDARRARLCGGGRRHCTRSEAPARLGGLAVDAAGAAVLGGAVFWRRLALAPQPQHRHGRAGGAGHRGHVHRQHRRGVRPQRSVRSRGLFRLADDVHQLFAARPLVRDAHAPPGRRGTRSGHRRDARDGVAPGH